MRRETTPSIEPLFPEGTPREVIDPDGKRMFDGFYFHFCKSVALFANEDKPEDYAHVVLRREIVDWGLPEKFILADVTPPHTIAAVEPEPERTCHNLLDGKTVRVFWCSACRWHSDAYTSKGDETHADEFISYCPHCGTRVVSRHEAGDTFDMEKARAAIEAVKKQIPNTLRMLGDF